MQVLAKSGVFQRFLKSGMGRAPVRGYYWSRDSGATAGGIPPFRACNMDGSAEWSSPCSLFVDTVLFMVMWNARFIGWR